MSWARDIAGGDLLGRGGEIHGEPFLLNPLYAYVIAPLVGATNVPILVFQTLLAGATAWLAASAATRLAGSKVAGWVAAVCVAFSTALTHLDGHVAVSGVAAFLVAGACWSCAPRERERERGHGPLAAGVWLGLSALARPIVLFALPLVMLLFVLREKSAPLRTRAAALVAVPFLVCAGISYTRNVAVSGEHVVFTAANGQNLYIGNNVAARRYRQMTTDEFRFAPREMHADAKYRLGFELGREPTRSEISSWFAGRAWDEFSAAPLASLAWYGEKLRWFFSPKEPASSADLDYDRQFAPLIALAFMPTWLIASLAGAAVLVASGRRELLLGPGALVFAHVTACSLTFPLEHYRSPGIPAMAVLAGCAVAAAWTGIREGTGRPLVLTLVAAGTLAIAGRVPPQPAYLRHMLLTNQSIGAIERRDFAAAERDARAALALEPEAMGAVESLSYLFRVQNRQEDARPWAEELVRRRPWNPLYRISVAWIDAHEGRIEAALQSMDELVAAFPWSALVRGERGMIVCFAGDIEAASLDLRWALDHGYVPEQWALDRCGIR